MKSRLFKKKQNFKCILRNRNNIEKTKAEIIKTLNLGLYF